MREKLPKKLIAPFAGLAIVALGGSLSHSGPTTTHAQTPTVQVH